MNTDNPSPAAAEPLQVSDHLLPALHAAAALGIETACEGEWDRDVHLETVRAAVHALDALEDGPCTREQIAVLAERAAAMQGEAMQADAEANIARSPVPIGAAWPTTADAAAVLKDRACLTQALIRLRDEARG